MSGTNGSARRPVAVVIGGAGFIGTNLAVALAKRGRRVRVFDNLSRLGVTRNVDWLLRTHGDAVELRVGDVRDVQAVRGVISDADEVYHLAAQVAVTTSLVDPAHDFEVNLRGTFNILEAIRARTNPPPLLFTSTNKVYGGLPDLGVVARGKRYRPIDPDLESRGVSEAHSLDFHSPYGCSKGGADQYVLDYARSYGIPATVFRLSSIYGPHQHGNEDQGWVAHFMLRTIARDAITIYGSGRQVRDLLFVDDLVDAMLLARDNIDRISGRAFNIGGGPKNTVSLLELIDAIEEIAGRRPEVSFDSWRVGDQRYYASSTSAFREATGWRPPVSVSSGLSVLWRWLLEDKAEARTDATERRFL